MWSSRCAFNNFQCIGDFFVNASLFISIVTVRCFSAPLPHITSGFGLVFLCDTDNSVVGIAVNFSCRQLLRIVTEVLFSGKAG